MGRRCCAALFCRPSSGYFCRHSLAVGVAWVVLVPAEYLGVTSGLGYAINDARDTLEYDTLAAMVVVIGVIGFFLDGLCVSLIKRFSWHHE